MRPIQKRATILLCSVAVVAFAASAFARPVHHHRHRAAAVAQSAAQAQTGADRDMRYSFNAAQEAAEQAATAGRGRRHSRHARVTRDPRQGTDVNASSVAAQSHSNSTFEGVTSATLVSEARKYIGTNPTGRGSLWCGAFMDLVLKRTGHTGGGNLASSYARYGTRISGPQVGAIAVMGRRGGGHVGVVSGIDPNGNPIVVSGNTWNRSTGGRHTVAESVYPRSRVYAYVMP